MFLILHPWAATTRDWFALAALIILFAVLVMPVRRPLWLRFGVIAVLTFLGAVALLSAPASAADTSASTVSASPWVAVVAPLAQSIAYTLVTGLVAVVAALIQRYVGIRIDQATQAKLDSYIENLAGAEIAKASDNLAKAQINVKSPIVKAIVDRVAADLPAEMQALGVTPEAVAAKAAGAFGKLQAQMTVIAAAPAAK